jgi:hypothetical protein
MVQASDEELSNVESAMILFLGSLSMDGVLRIRDRS